MDRRDLFARARALWPEAIVLSRSINNQQARQPIWEIVEVQDQIASGIDENDDWLALAVWAFHQALSSYASVNVRTGERALSPSLVTFEDFDRQMRANLADESWAAVRAQYDPALG